uniref:Mediator of RNA polymerase II transcription subunit 6 n=1 Tax=Sexangularia sp. CB-2014 TaxID=1486929 RepID=A0A7S1VD77_9EUKA|mmetsp:Transcript_16575/g.51857  ORF Transcript_16575/g.51857 Transcript_16575/m.51857 type:complete len:224 (+) Transcript_16575:73-744(+)
MTEEDIDKISFRDQTFLSTFQLHSDNAIDYFRLSPFYSPTCDNEVIRMQGLSPSSLLTMTGIQYTIAVVTNERPIAHVILVRKERRLSPERAVPLDFFYMLHGTVYKAPSLQEVLAGRLAAAADSLARCLSLLVECVAYTPGTGYTWAPSTTLPTTSTSSSTDPPPLHPVTPELLVDHSALETSETIPHFDEGGVNVAVRRLLADTAVHLTQAQAQTQTQAGD